jgi:glycosyltransferase involved in cell wall biosynthesis
VGKRITIVTAGHLSACPRMLKAADALTCAGHAVRVVSVNHTPWSTATDAVVRKTRTWASSVIDYNATSGRTLWLTSGVRQRTMRAMAFAVGPSRAPISVVTRAFSRVHDELVGETTAAPADLIYAGSTGALAAAAESADRLGIPYGIDFEDLHSGEHGGPGSELSNGLAARVERRVIYSAAFTTAGSPMIADAYAERYGVRPLAIHNTFSLAPVAASRQRDERLRLYWFSQTLGPQRGIEDVVRAAGEARVPVELHLRARPIPEYLDSLRRLHATVAPQLELVLHDPMNPDEMVAASQAFDAGLASEEQEPLNRRLCLSNKIFTYLAAGIPVLMTRTPAQGRLESSLGDAAFGYDCGDVQGLARIMRELSADAGRRARSREAARAAAERRWHWEHPEDRGALVDAVAKAL